MVEQLNTGFIILASVILLIFGGIIIFSLHLQSKRAEKEKPNNPTPQAIFMRSLIFGMVTMAILSFITITSGEKIKSWQIIVSILVIVAMFFMGIKSLQRLQPKSEAELYDIAIKYCFERWHAKPKTNATHGHSFKLWKVVGSTNSNRAFLDSSAYVYFDTDQGDVLMQINIYNAYILFAQINPPIDQVDKIFEFETAAQYDPTRRELMDIDEDVQQPYQQGQNNTVQNKT